MNSSEDAILLIRRLRLEGCSFWAEGNDIRIMPAGFLTPQDRELIRAHKPAVVAWLRATRLSIARRMMNCGGGAGCREATRDRA